MISTKLMKILALTMLMGNGVYADASFSKEATNAPILIQEGSKKAWCPVCGMALKKFYKTSHTHDKKQFCSVRCLIVDAKEHHHTTDDAQVVDAKTEKLIPAKSALYVVGSGVPGTMTKVSKFAFAQKSDAEAFAKKFGGEMVGFDKVIEMATASLESDIAMINAKKRKKIYPMGEKIFTKMCQDDINVTQYHAINELKSAIKEEKLCKPLDPMKHQAVSLYLWEVKRVALLEKSHATIHVTQEEKCPVCGMFTYKYPRWAAQIFYGEEHYSFDGVKDLMKFYFDPMRWGKFENAQTEKITKILVTDYYSQKGIDGRTAYYVLGSDVLGPMGNELIPFAQESDAKTFMQDHNGKRIVTFDTITEAEVYQLDE